MSLKAIHILFISAAMLLCLGFGGWALNNYVAFNGTTNLVYVIGSGVSFLTLAAYGVYFLRKLKKVDYL
jgi:hypothetical protein